MAGQAELHAGAALFALILFFGEGCVAISLIGYDLHHIPFGTEFEIFEEVQV